jgi:hypothetical protein
VTAGPLGHTNFVAGICSPNQGVYACLMTGGAGTSARAIGNLGNAYEQGVAGGIRVYR